MSKRARGAARVFLHKSRILVPLNKFYKNNGGKLNLYFGSVQNSASSAFQLLKLHMINAAARLKALGRQGPCTLCSLRFLQSLKQYLAHGCQLPPLPILSWLLYFRPFLFIMIFLEKCRWIYVLTNFFITPKTFLQLICYLSILFPNTTSLYPLSEGLIDQ